MRRAYPHPLRSSRCPFSKKQSLFSCDSLVFLPSPRPSRERYTLSPLPNFRLVFFPLQAGRQRPLSSPRASGGLIPGNIFTFNPSFGRDRLGLRRRGSGFFEPPLPIPAPRGDSFPVPPAQMLDVTCRTPSRRLPFFQCLSFPLFPEKPPPLLSAPSPFPLLFCDGNSSSLRAVMIDFPMSPYSTEHSHGCSRETFSSQ